MECVELPLLECDSLRAADVFVLRHENRKEPDRDVFSLAWNCQRIVTIGEFVAGRFLRVRTAFALAFELERKKRARVEVNERGNVRTNEVLFK